jgi:hypothetical protein
MGALTASFLLAPTAIMACRNPPEPSALRAKEADAIVLTTITDVQPTGGKIIDWTAIATVTAQLWGKIAEREIPFEASSPGSCEGISKPRIGKFYVLYLRKHDGGFLVNPNSFWWAWQSGDPRLAKLRELFPLGNVRHPTVAEAIILDYAERRLKLPEVRGKLSDYTRIYARSSAGSARAVLLRSRTPQRLMVDYDEEMPTRESCSCRLYEQFVDLQDLWNAGKLPPFNP